MEIVRENVPAKPSSNQPSNHSWTSYVRATTVGFWGVHVTALVGILVLGFSWKGVAIALTSYFIRMFVVTCCYHRYFSHRSFKTSRWFQFIMALAAQSAGQKGVLWWAGHHRWHHKHSDTALDVHSAKLKGFYYSHMGWIMRPDWNDTDEKSVADLSKYPELRFLNHPAIAMLPTVVLACFFLLFGGTMGLFWGFFVSTVLLWHGSFSINSLSHVFGDKRYDTGEESRNNFWLAILTTGEGWHNNHHHFMSSANQGWHWWQVDVTFYMIRLMEMLGLVWDVRRPPQHIVDAPRPAELPAESTARAA
jgi:stearoyl-CoA desaturase (delta-9 desaturase)